MKRELVNICITVILVIALALPIVMVPAHSEPMEVYVVAVDNAGNSNYIPSLGNGTFGSQEYVGQIPQAFPTYGCGIGDFDNDGYFDYVIGSGGLHQPDPSIVEPHIYLYEKLGPGNNFAPPVSVGTWTQSRIATDFAVADYNKDGKMDFILIHMGSSNSELYLGDGDLTFTSTVLSDTSPFNGFGADSADFNNDGNADFAVAQFNGSAPYYVYINLGNGNGTFTTTSFEASSDAFGLTAANFDDDGNADIVSGGASTNGWYFYKGRGNGTFEAGVLLSGVPSNYSPIDNYDFNNDGNQDIIIGYGLSALYYSGDGHGTFNYGTEITGGSGYERYAISAPPTEMAPIVPGPRARFTWDPEKPFVNEPATFNASASHSGWNGAPIIRYAWDFETDGIIDDFGEIVTHTFSATGIYTVTLNVTDEQGFWDTKTYTMKVGLTLVIEDGVTWLAAQQEPDGSWEGTNPVGETALAVLKLEEHAVDWKYGYGLTSPFDPNYPYREHVEKGLSYLFAHAYVTNISVQPAGDPDTNGDGKGVYFMSAWWDTQHRTYETSTVMMAIAGSRAPDRMVNVSGSQVDGWQYRTLLEDTVDYFAWSQADGGTSRGGWGYAECDNGTWTIWWDRSDQSTSGWATFGLGFAESPAYKFAITIPAFVKTELNFWMGYIQIDAEGDPNDGGASYRDPQIEGANILRTGHLLYMMAFVGDAATTQRVQDAVAYIVRHWNDPDDDPGWKGYPDASSRFGANYQAMLNVMKGLFALGIQEIGGIDWQREFERVLAAQQLDDGSWPYTIWGDKILSTAWALLVLEKVAPPPPVITVYVDIKPGSWPNPIDIGSKGVFTGAICGTADFDVMTIDLSTVKIYIERVEEGVAPLRWSYEDVATPFTGPPGGGHDLNGDGFLDLVFHFDTQEVVNALGLSVHVGQTIPLIIRGNLNEASGGTGIQGQDYVRVQEPPRLWKLKLTER